MYVKLKLNNLLTGVFLHDQLMGIPLQFSLLKIHAASLSSF